MTETRKDTPVFIRAERDRVDKWKRAFRKSKKDSFSLWAREVLDAAAARQLALPPGTTEAAA